MTNPQALISDYYREQNAQLHRETKWGESGRHSAELVYAAAIIFGAADILDYGCGRGTLKAELKKVLGLKTPIHEYDPAIPGKDELPDRAFDFVTCTDVLEHVEPECIDAVMAHIFNLTKRYAYFIISCKEASRLLPDGRNAHVLVRDPEWWVEKFDAMGWKRISFYKVNDRNDKLREVRLWVQKP